MPAKRKSGKPAGSAGKAFPVRGGRPEDGSTGLVTPIVPPVDGLPGSPGDPALSSAGRTAAPKSGPVSRNGGGAGVGRGRGASAARRYAFRRS